jgi:hypothetical protein
LPHSTLITLFPAALPTIEVGEINVNTGAVLSKSNSSVALKFAGIEIAAGASYLVSAASASLFQDKTTSLNSSFVAE